MSNLIQDDDDPKRLNYLVSFLKKDWKQLHIFRKELALTDLRDVLSLGMSIFATYMKARKEGYTALLFVDPNTGDYKPAQLPKKLQEILNVEENPESLKNFKEDIRALEGATGSESGGGNEEETC